jgi:AcrR family transcriptional regulator
MSTQRTYTMRARARSTAETRERILRAGMDLWGERLTLSIGLSDVAERAQVTVRTVLRHFGSRDGLFDAIAEFAREIVVAERQAPVGDTRAAARIIVDHYELRGDVVLRMLEEANVDKTIAALAARGRRLHREWMRTVFAPQLQRSGDDCTVLEDLLVVATDVYTWKLLRRDAGLSRARTEERMHTMIRRLVEGRG